MGIVERREREREQRRNDIIDAAEKVFFSKSMITATMDEVAEVAELSKGTLYLYFKSKEDLYFAINARGLRILEQMFRDALTKSSIGLEKIRATGQTYYEFYKKYPDYFHAMIYYDLRENKSNIDESCAEECFDQGEKTLQVVAEAIQIGIQDGSIRADVDPFKTAVILWGQSTGMIQILSHKGDHIQEEHDFDIEELYNLSIEMALRSLRK